MEFQVDNLQVSVVLIWWEWGWGRREKLRRDPLSLSHLKTCNCDLGEGLWLLGAQGRLRIQRKEASDAE